MKCIYLSHKIIISVTAFSPNSLLTNVTSSWTPAGPFPYMYVEIFQLDQVVVKQSSSNVVKWLGGFLIGLLNNDTIKNIITIKKSNKSDKLIGRHFKVVILTW